MLFALTCWLKSNISLGARQLEMHERRSNKMPNTNEDFKAFLGAELKTIDDARKKNFEGKDIKPWASLSVGENIVKFLPQPARPHPIYSNRMVFRVEQDGEVRDLGLSTAGKLYRDVLTALASGKMTLTIIRVGTGKTD